MLYGYDADGKAVSPKPVPLSKLDRAQLHALFQTHFKRDSGVEAPGFVTRMWRRLFGWAYGVSTLEAVVLFICGASVVSIACYALCWRYTQLCDQIQDL